MGARPIKDKSTDDTGRTTGAKLNESRVGSANVGTMVLATTVGRTTTEDAICETLKEDSSAPTGGVIGINTPVNEASITTDSGSPIAGSEGRTNEKLVAGVTTATEGDKLGTDAGTNSTGAVGFDSCGATGI